MSFVNHYVILGLPSGGEGVQLSEQQIKRAFKLKALEIHPDKRPDVDQATANSDFQRLQQSYQILIDTASRQLFDAELLTRLRTPQQPRQQEKQRRARTRKRGGADWREKVGEDAARRWETYQEEGKFWRANSCPNDPIGQWWRKNMNEEEEVEARWWRKTGKEEEVGRRTTKEAEEAKFWDMEEEAQRMNLLNNIKEILATKRKAGAVHRANQANAAEELQKQEMDRIRAKKARFESVAAPS